MTTYLLQPRITLPFKDILSLRSFSYKEKSRGQTHCRCKIKLLWKANFVISYLPSARLDFDYKAFLLLLPGVDQHEQPVDRDQLLRQHCNLCHEGLQVPAGNLRREEIFVIRVSKSVLNPLQTYLKAYWPTLEWAHELKQMQIWATALVSISIMFKDAEFYTLIGWLGGCSTHIVEQDIVTKAKAFCHEGFYQA